MKRLLSFVLLLIALELHAADSTYSETPITLQTATGDIEGTLVLPMKMGRKIPVALIIAGSGPTDRNGNSYLIKGANNSLLYMAQGLAAKGIASIRYDKRGVGKSMKAMKAEADLRIDDYIDDARGWITLLRADRRFGTITVIGHSEGSLIGMVAAAAGADRFVSIAGAGFPADEILKIQLAGFGDSLRLKAVSALDSLKSGLMVRRPPPALLALFRPSVQPYLISWFRLDPRVLISKLKVPVLIVQGDNDLQVSLADAQSLKAAAPRASLLILPGMNHVLKVVVEREMTGQLKTYGDPSLTLSPQLAAAITAFINLK